MSNNNQQEGQEYRIETLARALWEIRKHSLLALAGHPTDWDSQPQSVKNGERRDARAALKAIDHKGIIISQLDQIESGLCACLIGSTGKIEHSDALAVVRAALKGEEQ